MTGSASGDTVVPDRRSLVRQLPRPYRSTKRSGTMSIVDSIRDAFSPEITSLIQTATGLDAVRVNGALAVGGPILAGALARRAAGVGSDELFQLIPLRTGRLAGVTGLFNGRERLAAILPAIFGSGLG